MFILILYKLLYELIKIFVKTILIIKILIKKNF